MKRIDLFALASSLDENEPLHLSRLLVLISAFRREDGPAVKGITKLAKLDFLLRYPSYFEHALIARGVSPARIGLAHEERLTIEAQMVRYRFGPWDHRYRRFLNMLASKRLVSISTLGRTIQIDLTERGEEIVSHLLDFPEFGKLSDRAKLLRQHLDLSAKSIMDFIYDTFPEITTLEFNEPIGAEVADI